MGRGLFSNTRLLHVVGLVARKLQFQFVLFTILSRSEEKTGYLCFVDSKRSLCYFSLAILDARDVRQPHSSWCFTERESIYSPPPRVLLFLLPLFPLASVFLQNVQTREVGVLMSVD